MKRTLVTIAAVTCVFAGTAAKAVTLGSQAIPVQATVDCYSAIQSFVAPDVMTFVGLPGESITKGFSVTKESNCTVTATAAVTTALTNGVDVIATTLVGDVTVINAMGVATDNFQVNGTLGASVSSQAAGAYTGEVTVTIATP